jgi:hypothetical protein
MRQPLPVIQFLAILLTAVALVPGGAHLLALRNKIGLAQSPYFVVQQIYRGWNVLAIVLIAAVIVDFYLAVLLRDQRVPFLLGLAGALCVAATLATFFVWVFPGNQATDNWVTAPPNWERLRRRWEYGHAASALLTLLGLGLIVAASLAANRGAGD